MTKQELAFLDLLGDSDDTVHIAVHGIAGIQGWFGAFIKSSDFGKLNDDLKQEALDTFLHLKFILEMAEEVAMVRARRREACSS